MAFKDNTFQSKGVIAHFVIPDLIRNLLLERCTLSNCYKMVETLGYNNNDAPLEFFFYLHLFKQRLFATAITTDKLEKITYALSAARWIRLAPLPKKINFQGALNESNKVVFNRII